MAEHASEAGHWYARDGSPVYTMIGKNGKERPTTLRDARVLDLAPSVTGIIRMAAAPGLEHWRQNQMMLAALTLPRGADEPESDWIKRVWHDAGEHARNAAARGTAIHAAIQQHYEAQAPDPELWPYVQAAVRCIGEACPGTRWIAEKSFCHELGFGGKTDLHSPEHSIVLDVKTKEFSDPSTLVTWDEHHMQLSAYGRGLAIERPRCGIVYVSANNPGLARLIWINQEDIERGWSMFMALFCYWQAKNRISK